MQLFGDRQRAEVECIGAEVLARAFLVEARVVRDLANFARLECFARVHGDPVLEHFMQQRVIVVGQRRQHRHGVRVDVDDLEQQHRVMRRQRTSAFADDVGHRQLMLTTDLGQRVHDVVGVFLRRVVDACFGGGVGAVVVHAQSTANVHVRHVDAHATQLGVESRHLLQSGLDVADVRNLAAEMEVDQLENIESAH